MLSGGESWPRWRSPLKRVLLGERAANVKDDGPRPTLGAPKAVLALAIGLAQAGCLSEANVDADMFGYTYSIRTTGIASAPPMLEGDRLVVVVAYGGCADGQTFAVRSRPVMFNDAEVWLFKSSPRQGGCQALFIERKEFHLSPGTSTARRITLLGPDGDEYRLR
jgi:hypothetical protein